jgi:4-hydroxy-3-methylbut-2-enyl diphosphate reductase IspH
VRRVVKMAEQHIAETGEPLVSLGDVIHNEAEIGRLKEIGLSEASIAAAIRSLLRDEPMPVSRTCKEHDATATKIGDVN